MIFKISKKLKGSCVLNTLKKVITAGMTISIENNDLYAPDIKAAIRSGILVPVNEEYSSRMMGISNEVIIMNRSEKVLVLGKIVLKPNSSLVIDKDISKSDIIISAKNKGLIEILSDDEFVFVDEQNEDIFEAEEQEDIENIVEEKKKTKKINKKKSKKEEQKSNISKSGEEIEVTPTVWDFRSKTLEEAQEVPKTPDIISIDEKEKEVDFIDKVELPKKRGRKPKQKIEQENKIGINKTNKKEDIGKKKTKVKSIEPVGEVKQPKTVGDAAIELDSRGNPIGEKVSDTLQHLIDTLGSPEDIDFV